MARTLRAGALTAALDAGKLRWIRFGGAEALRGLAFVVRGAGWGNLRAADHEPGDRGGGGLLSCRLRRAHRLRRRQPRLPRRHRGGERAEPGLHGRVSARIRVQDQPHGLRRAPSGRGRGGRGLHHHAQRRHAGGDRLPRPDHAVAALLRHRGHAPPGLAGGLAHLPLRGRRSVGDRGPAQLDRRILQDLLPPSRAALSLHARRRRDAAPGRDAQHRGGLRSRFDSGRRRRRGGRDRLGRRDRAAYAGKSGSASPPRNAATSTTGSTCSERSDPGTSSANATRAIPTRWSLSPLAAPWPRASMQRWCWRSWCPASGRWPTSWRRRPRSRTGPGLRRPPSCPSRRGS